MKHRCHNCKHYTDETLTSTGICIGYCYYKERKWYGLFDRNIYADSTCRYFEEKDNVGQITFIPER